MNGKRTCEREAEFTITVKHFSDNSAQVSIESDDCKPVDFMCATEYMIWTYAHQWELPLEEAARRLREGAKTYVSSVVTMPVKE